MKKSELTRIIKEEIQKVLREGYPTDIEVPGDLVRHATDTGDYFGELEDMIKDQTEDQPQMGRKFLKALATQVEVIKVDLDEADNPDADIDDMIETSTPIAQLAKVSKEWARDWAGKGYKYFSFIPVDYNRGTNYINLGVSKVPDVLERIVGDY